MSDAQKPGGWPDAARPGYPANPERDGWHWLRNRWGATVPALWLASDGMWRLNDANYSAKNAGRNQEYLGPCHTPAEVAAARREEREACAAVCEDVRNQPGEDTAIAAGVWRITARECRDRIRARGGA
jgi:hypothetical protein